ncbi:bifunctional diguanylate cyclase/phosphodiesterase [Roseibium aquae]|uniref:Bifunctional diguanylate cyclase/phosphodiesterase n=1 Tax=Roseibium aquae TaxID=1323746 RepID=A0A916TLN3_9HYPH|nr:GGDEF and EAL domain-containing protein [Roseibium aquae]GGB54782.1 bifunctional diguanylate cyclase/phosphodiesterase [Roseibium aquae]
MRKHLAHRRAGKPGDGAPGAPDKTVDEARSRFGIPQDWSGGKDLLLTVLDSVSDYLYLKDRDGRFLLANAAVAKDLGLDDPSYLIGRSDRELHAPDLAEKFSKDEKWVLESGQPKLDYEDYVDLPDGSRRWFSSSKFPVRNSEGEVVGLFGVSRDISERKRAEALRIGQARVLELLATGASLPDVLDSLVLLIQDQLDDVFGSILLLDDSGEHLLHGAAPSLPEAYCKAVSGVKIGPRVGSCGTAAWRGEKVIVADIETDPLWEEYRGLILPFGYKSCWSAPVFARDGSVLGTFALYSKSVRKPTQFEQRLTEETTRLAAIAIERAKADQQISFLAHHDTLTGLRNRHDLKRELDRLIHEVEPLSQKVAVVFFDLDQFKSVNDSFGHSIGDEVLRIVAERIRLLVREEDLMVRFGGDEFIIVIKDKRADRLKLVQLMSDIRRKVAEPILLANKTFHVTCSMGVARYPDDGVDGETLLLHADSAMYRAKESGRDRFQFYTPCMREAEPQRLTLLEDMRVGLERGEFRLDYQPQIDLETGRITGVEALVRWDHPELGTLMPGAFIPLAEDSGLITNLGQWVMWEACRQNKEWAEAGLPPVRVGVNVSARQFREENFIDQVREALKMTGLNPANLELEITESLIIQNKSHAVPVMQELRSLGVKLAIDDFGTGYSSLSALGSFPLTKLKIDRTFISMMDTQTQQRFIARAIVSLGHDMGLSVIAEGVETAEQLELLKSFGCDEAQGYHLGRPMPAESIAQMLMCPAAVAPGKAVHAG